MHHYNTVENCLSFDMRHFLIKAKKFKGHITSASTKKLNLVSLKFVIWNVSNPDPEKIKIQWGL
jgi:hypothetical protein